MPKARDLSNVVSQNGVLADGTISAREITGLVFRVYKANGTSSVIPFAPGGAALPFFDRNNAAKNVALTTS